MFKPNQMKWDTLHGSHPHRLHLGRAITLFWLLTKLFEIYEIAVFYLAPNFARSGKSFEAKLSSSPSSFLKSIRIFVTLSYLLITVWIVTRILNNLIPNQLVLLNMHYLYCQNIKCKVIPTVFQNAYSYHLCYIIE